MASGPLGQPSGYKFFLAAAEPDSFLTAEAGPIYLVQLAIADQSGEVHVTLKSTNTKENASLRFLEYIVSVFRPLGLLP
jgi:hypothetical protein